MNALQASKAAAGVARFGMRSVAGLLPVVLLLAAQAPSANGALIAGWYDFAEPGSETQGTTKVLADFTAPGVTATVVNSSNSFPAIDAWSSTDGAYGSSLSTGAADTAGNGGAANGARGLRVADFDSWIDFAITNSSGGDLTLDSVMFDIGKLQSATTTPNRLTLSYLSGDLDDADNTPINTVSGLRPPGDFGFVGTFEDYVDFDWSLSPLSDQSLASGESASFRFAVSEADGAANNAMAIDNVAFTGDVGQGGLDVEYLIVGGGGGGGGQRGGGGGAGGLLENFTGSPWSVGVGSYSVDVGAGGIGGSGSPPYTGGSSGGDSSVFGFTAFGGGGGALTNDDGLDGGSGGGGGADGPGVAPFPSGGTANPAVQGNNGGDGAGYPGVQNAAGGGGGAGAAGGNATADSGGATAGDGGVGMDLSAFLGTSVGESGVFAGGGGGGADLRDSDNAVGSGGLGGGGGGSLFGDGVPGVANTGGGGGGGSADFSTIFGDGGDGGGGVVILRYLLDESFDQAVGGSEFTFNDGLNDYRVHVFNAGGDFVVNAAPSTVIPEPSTLAIWALGLLGLGWYGHRRRKR